MMKKFPIGIQSFKKIRKIQGVYYYVDKTAFVEKLVNTGGYFFLSRPRRFGKSLFLDTLRQAFQGNKVYFNGLYLENNSTIRSSILALVPVFFGVLKSFVPKWNQY